MKYFHSDDNAAAQWLKGISYEVAFWNNVYRWRHTLQGLLGWSHYGAAIELEEFDANAFLTQQLDNGDNPVVLDVGCGMSYATGNYLSRGNELLPLDIHYIDPLAAEFNNILDRHRRDMPKIEFGMAEYLSAFYPQHNVSLVVIQNALDHSAHPIKGIIEAMDTLKTGGILYLNHHPDEAVTEHYKGFHQWNINERDGQLVIWNENELHQVNTLIAAFADIEVRRHDNGHVIAIIRKKDQVPAHMLTDKDDKRQLCQLLMHLGSKQRELMPALSLKMDYWRYNTIQFAVQALPWRLKMGLKKIIKQA